MRTARPAVGQQLAMPYSPREAAVVVAVRHPSCTLGVCSFACAVELSDEEAAAGAVTLQRGAVSEPSAVRPCIAVLERV